MRQCNNPPKRDKIGQDRYEYGIAPKDSEFNSTKRECREMQQSTCPGGIEERSILATSYNAVCISAGPIDMLLFPTESEKSQDASFYGYWISTACRYLSICNFCLLLDFTFHTVGTTCRLFNMSTIMSTVQHVDCSRAWTGCKSGVSISETHLPVQYARCE